LAPLSVEPSQRASSEDRSAGGNPLRIAGRRYHRGLGVRAGTLVRYFLGRGYDTFSGQIGIDDETNGAGSCVFEIHVDGDLLFRSDTMRGGKPAESVEVPVAGRSMLTLAVTDAGDGEENDHADWGNAFLQASRAAPPGRRTGVAIDTSLGIIVVELDADRTPATVANFLRYVEEEFYDGTAFHRVVRGFVIQGGGYTPDLAEKTPYDPIPNEAARGGSNVRGTIAMGRRPEPDSATCQFYINVRDNLALDTLNGGYCVFGRVLQGMDVVDRIAALPTQARQTGLEHVPVATVVIRSVRRQ
jgi:cyclophilin family peptidyl-prolyl cis-trans isomerase